MPASVLHSDGERVRFVVDVPTPVFKPSSALSGFETISIKGFGAIGNPGEPPTMSRNFLVALPPTGSYAVSARIVGTQLLGTHRLEPNPTPAILEDEEMGTLTTERVVWDEATYRAWVAPDVVVHDAPAYIRRQRMISVSVNPVFYDVSTNDVVVATQVEVDIRFEGGRDTRAVGAPSSDLQRWGETFGRLFVNAPQTRSWQTPKPQLASTGGLAARVAPGAVKLTVRATGVHKVSASTLLAAGFPAGQPVDNVRLYRRTYDDATLTAGETDVPYYVREGAGGVAGVLDANDLVIFYGLRVRDDALQGDPREQYSSTNVYWFEPSAGTAMATRSPGAGFVTADTTSAFFPATAHFETDAFFHLSAPPHALDAYFSSSGRVVGPIETPMTIGAVRPGGSLGITAEIHGYQYGSGLRSVRISLANSKGETVLVPDFFVNEKNRVIYTSAPIPATSLDVGINILRVGKPAGATRSFVEAMVNFVDVSYGSLYRARANTLKFNTATLAGDTSITVTGLSSTTDFELFDITAPVAPIRCVTNASHFVNVPGGFAFSFRENVPSRREFVLVPVSRMIDIPVADVKLDVASTIVGGAAESGIDVLVVAHGTFIAQMQSWASYRRAQGYRVLLADVEDVYDEFNGGVLNARAIQRFTRHFYERADASALVLVGDSSEDEKHVSVDSGPNFVPSILWMDNVGGLLLDETLTTDKRFVKMPAPGGGPTDIYPDMIVGRLPAGSTSELGIMLSKTIEFESPDASQFWRKRMIVISDDAYSEGTVQVGGGLVNYCWQAETGFEEGQANTIASMENSLPAGYDIVPFNLRTYTSSFYPCTVQPSGGCLGTDCTGARPAWQFVRQNATERLMNELNQGATLVTVQAHISRATITHERLFTNESASILDTGSGKDPARLTNIGRPWIMFGMGCHFSAYAIVAEQSSAYTSSNSPNGDALAEQLLFQNNRGAVGTYGSTGYEFLTANNRYMDRWAEVWFYTAGYDTMVNQTQAEWKFGEVMFLVETELANTQLEPVERYHILGDPLLRVDAGPPIFEVTANGNAISTGDVLSAAGSDSVRVVAVVTDENAIRDFSLEIAGIDASDQLHIEALTDSLLPRSRQYRVSFSHVLRPDSYDIVLRAFQAPDTLAGSYHIAAEFVMRVASSVEVSVNGRVLTSGGSVPVTGSYRIDLEFPVYIPGSEIGVAIDDEPVSPLTISNPAPEDSLTWIVTFQKTLGAGTHHMRITAGPTIAFDYQLVVSQEAGLRDLLNYPNPFREAGTHFMYSNDMEITSGSIDIYTVSGKRVRRLDIPVGSRQPGSNAVFWDGRDNAGDVLANGTYLYVIKIDQRGSSATARGKLAKVQ